MEEPAGEAPDVAHAQHRAGHGHSQHGHGLNKALGLKVPLDHQIGNDHAQKGRNGGSDEAQDEGIPEGLEPVIAAEHQLEPLARQGEELKAPGGEAGPDGHAQVHHDDEQSNQGAEYRQGDFDASVGDQHPAPGGLAGEGGGGFPL